MNILKLVTKTNHQRNERTNQNVEFQPGVVIIKFCNVCVNILMGLRTDGRKFRYTGKKTEDQTMENGKQTDIPPYTYSLLYFITSVTKFPP